MKFPKSKLIWPVVLVVVSIIALSEIHTYLDPGVDSAKDYLLSNKYLEMRVGQINKISLRRTVRYQGTPTDSPFIEYTFRVWTKKDSHSIAVRVYPDDRENVDSYVVYWLDGERVNK